MQRYEEDDMVYWKQRLTESSREASGFRPPPVHPVLRSVRELLDGYQTPRSNIPSDEKIRILHAIVGDAARRLQPLESKSCDDF